ncbi:hypothetical protein JG688_00018028 [Phytophthora aleatoria]|uniref:HAT C-terminal dimerisation domain-containing protein n=1 Tax=Phytophthora aleatoria TaxID=2496075 RepID=A0A8J5LUZ2_9STRA|nr:hypothetical protein JG688_00018028 [Phytophthora aleatoria]
MENRFTRTRPSEFDGSPWELWEYVAKENPKSLLPKLAMRVLSIVVNTATCERLFSELGIIHTAKRNRLASDKALDIQTVGRLARSPASAEARGSQSEETDTDVPGCAQNSMRCTHWNVYPFATKNASEKCCC